MAKKSSRKRFIRRIRHRLVYRVVQLLIFVSGLVPRTWWLAWCGMMGNLAYHFAPKTRKLTLTHIALAFPEWANRKVAYLARQNFKMLAKNAGEILLATRIKSEADLEKILTIHGFENYEQARAKGKGVIFLTCHLGAFDLQITVMSLKGLKPLIIGTPLKNKYLNELLWKQRNAHGAVAIERGKETFRLIKELKSGGSLAILIDQDTKVKSRFVNFFGRPAATPVGAAIFAMKTGACIVPTYVYLGDDNRQHMHFLPEIETVLTGNEENDMVANTQRYSDFIESKIRQHPEQWVWMHERWKTKPGEEIL
jgi:Kdo2-lipid IVA lauroyltransferase/acyltransferase